MMSDTTLLEGAKRMDKAALVAIFERYAPALYNYTFRLCSDASLADHIVGNVFVKLLEHLSAGRGPGTNLRSYLYEMAYHLVIDEVRYSYRASPIEMVDWSHHDPYSTYLSFEERILFETARRAIQKDLSAGQRHVIILRCLEGFSLKEQQRSLEKKWVT